MLDGGKFSRDLVKATLLDAAMVARGLNQIRLRRARMRGRLVKAMSHLARLAFGRINFFSSAYRAEEAERGES